VTGENTLSGGTRDYHGWIVDGGMVGGGMGEVLLAGDTSVEMCLKFDLNQIVAAKTLLLWKIPK